MSVYVFALIFGMAHKSIFRTLIARNVDVEVNVVVVVGVVMLPFSYLQLFTLCQTNKHNQPYTHACTDACRLCMCVMCVCVCATGHDVRATVKKSEKQIAGIL